MEDDIKITESIKSSLNRMIYWSKFLSILGFIGIGFMLLFAIGCAIIGFFIPFEEGFPMQIIITYVYPLLYLGLAAIYYFPINYLYKFAVKGRKGLIEKNQDNMENSLSNLALGFRYIGIMTIVIISIYVLTFISAIIIAVFASTYSIF
tara:strand:+ start:1253 stop:1699 length:447 start_codon:yes stop_codon:yes gene_type:complete